MKTLKNKVRFLLVEFLNVSNEELENLFTQRRGKAIRKGQLNSEKFRIMASK